MFDNFLPIPDAESLPFYPSVLKLVLCVPASPIAPTYARRPARSRRLATAGRPARSRLFTRQPDRAEGETRGTGRRGTRRHRGREGEREMENEGRREEADTTVARSVGKPRLIHSGLIHATGLTRIHATRHEITKDSTHPFDQ